MKKLDDYLPIVGQGVLDEIRAAALPLRGKHIVHVNSTYYGGGVAEILSTLVLLFNDLGIRCGWRLLKGEPAFFNVTKSFHNALQGAEVDLSPEVKSVYEGVNEINSVFTHFHDHDAVIIHDPQPLPQILFHPKRQPWIWRCHIDFTQPNPALWAYLKGFVEKYDAMIVSKEEYKKDIPLLQYLIAPTIDPISTKNGEMSDEEASRLLEEHGIPLDKPIISQISRFDIWKDPLSVIATYKEVKKQIDCTLVLLGSPASDDPEGQAIFEEILQATHDDDQIHVLNFSSDILVNALQRKADVVLQMSKKEGFGLTVTEALWKKTPVVARPSGGIPLQIQHGESGYLVNTPAEAAKAVIELLGDVAKRTRMGEAGHQHVKQHFLSTRHLLDYLHLLTDLIL